ncbi:MAG: membrane AbrB-like protein [Parasphingorhabdus sp.]|jgi:membrane AbrB-like protein
MLFAWCAGYFLNLLGAPAPYLLGSLFGVWLIGSFVAPLGRIFRITRWLHRSIILGLSTLLGAMFTPAIFDNLGTWSFTVLVMTLVTLLSAIVSFLFFTRMRGYEPRLAMLCSAPGGQAEIVMLSRDLVDKDYVVALCHLVRVVMVFCIVPFLLAFTQGQVAVDASNTALFELPGVADIPYHVLLQFAGLALGGFVLARGLKLPMPHLVGPLILSGLCHIVGWVDLPRISEFVLLAQLAIGSAIGARLCRVAWREIFGYLKDAIINAVFIVILFISAAWLVAQFTQPTFLNLTLAYMPGGIYEVTLLALLFSFDVAFVAFHHTIRVLIIFLSLPLFWKKFGARQTADTQE